MKLNLTSALFSCTILFAFTVGTACNKDTKTLVENAYAINSGSWLIRFDRNDLGATAGIKISNLQAGESILGLDFRPADGVLYGLGSSNHLYIIDKETGVASRIVPAFTPVLSGTAFGFDFNPSSDRIRVISNTGQNLRLHPVTGEVVSIDTDITPAGIALSACAYSNNAAGATTTELYAINASTDKLYKITSPNSGMATEIGPLGIDVDANNGFDIAGADNGFALLTVAGVPKLYSVNLSTGALTEMGKITVPPPGAGTLTCLAVLP
jgi:outer membrane protein assembly factor BamB